MSEYSGPRMGPEDLMGQCLCGLNRGAHRPSERYYRELELEGHMSSSMSLREHGCPSYRESGMTLGEGMRLRHCMRRYQEER